MSEEYAPADPKKAILSFNQGANLMAEGDEQSAIASWHEALELDPALIPAAFNLITYYQGKNDLEAELRLWELVLAFDPFDTDNLVLQAAALRKAGQLALAVANYQRAIAIYPYFKFWYHELAQVYRDAGDESEASLWKGRGDSLDADIAEMCYEDGVRHAEEKRWTSARTCFEAVLDDFPANLDARLRLTDVLEHCGTPKEVEKQFETALDLTQAAKGLVLFRMGQFHLARQEEERAMECFQQALHTEPKYRKAARVLQALKSGAPLEPAAANQAPAVMATQPPRDPTGEQQAVLQPDEIGMERIDTLPPTPIPEFRTPNPRLPWQQQLRQVLDQVLSIASPGGVEPRVALVVEASHELAPVVTHTMSDLVGIGRSLRADAERSHVFVVESGEKMRSGWLGRDEVFGGQPHQWQRTNPGFSLQRCLEVVRTGSASQGFNCLILISFGRCQEEPVDAKRLIALSRIYSLCAIYPQYHYVDAKALLAEAAPNFMEITV